MLELCWPPQVLVFWYIDLQFILALPIILDRSSQFVPHGICSSPCGMAFSPVELLQLGAACSVFTTNNFLVCDTM
ncbi:unnamed protein product [Urochloa humidicola]